MPKQLLPFFYVHRDGRDIFGDEVLVPREGMEVRNYMNRDSVVEDWDAAAKIWEHALIKRLQPGRPTPPSKNGLNIADNGDVVMEDADGAGAGGEGGGENEADAHEK